MKPGDTLSVLGEAVTAKATGEETGGTMTAVEVVTPPGGGPPPHRHHYAELLYVLDGSLEVEIESELSSLQSGGMAAIPSGTAHTYRNASAQPVRFLAVLQPAGYERFFAELGSPIGTPRQEAPDPARVIEVARRHGVEFVGPPPAASP